MTVPAASSAIHDASALSRIAADRGVEAEPAGHHPVEGLLQHQHVTGLATLLGPFGRPQAT